MSGGFKARKRQDDWATTIDRGASSTPASQHQVYRRAWSHTLGKRDENKLNQFLHQRVSQLRMEWEQVRDTAPPTFRRQILDAFQAGVTASMIAFLRWTFDRKNRVSSPPGLSLFAFADFIYSKKTVEGIVAPLIADMQFEYNEALLAGRKYKAMWVRVRGAWCFFKTLGVYSALRAFVEIWRKVISA